MQTPLVGRLRTITRKVATAVRPPAATPLPEPAPSVDAYWSEHTVTATEFATRDASLAYLEWRSAEYPRYRELMDVWGDHDGEVVLDYGCGPGDDLLGFLLFSGAARVVGVDVSERALALARARLELHSIDPRRYELLRTSDAQSAIDLPDASVDFVHCGGVLHHVSDPLRALRELRRVLVDGGRANVMVYNRRSVWYHLYAAYALMILPGVGGLSLDEVFARSTDGELCPISRAYDPDSFLALARFGGFDGEFVGGYLSRIELDVLSTWGERAKRDGRLAAEHREFLERFTFDGDGLPMIDGKYAGIGGSYRLCANAVDA